jgi:hypothetical protein
MPRELTEEEWKVRFGADSLPAYARAALSAVDARGWMHPDTQKTVAAFQRAYGIIPHGLYDEETAKAAAFAAKAPAPRAFSFGAESVSSVDLRAVQTKLNSLGYKPALVVDGVSGNKTLSGLLWFQKSEGLPQTGVFDGATITALDLPKKTGAPPNSLVDQAIDLVVPGLRSAVVKAWVKFNAPKESYLDFMYTDSIGLVTTGMGNMIENRAAHGPDAITFTLPWKHRGSGALATHAEVDAAWHAVKNAWPKVQSTASRSLTDLYLEPDAINRLWAGRLAANQTTLQRLFSKFSTWPADAQGAAHSMSWAMGTGDPGNPSAGGLASFRTLVNALNQDPPDFRTAADNSFMKGGGISERNAADKQMFLNAAAIQEKNLDYDSLYFPADPFELGVRAFMAVARIPTWVKVTAGVATATGMVALGQALMKRS